MDKYVYKFSDDFFFLFLRNYGKEVSSYLQVDDTGARHQDKNGYCTYIGNDLFAWFKSTERKSRMNFLDLLRAEPQDYVVNAGVLEYMERQKLVY